MASRHCVTPLNAWGCDARNASLGLAVLSTSAPRIDERRSSTSLATISPQEDLKTGCHAAKTKAKAAEASYWL